MPVFEHTKKKAEIKAKLANVKERIRQMEDPTMKPKTPKSVPVKSECEHTIPHLLHYLFGPGTDLLTLNSRQNVKLGRPR